MAIREFCQSCTIPIIAENEEIAGVDGTGVLFEINNSIYFITAYHVAKNIYNYPNKYGIPVGKNKSDVFTFKDCEIIYPEDESERKLYDAALIPLSTNPRLCDVLLENYVCLNIENIGEYHNTPDNYLLAGYPSKLSKALPNYNVQGKFFMLVTPPFVGHVDERFNVNPSCDILLDYGKLIIDESGKTVEAPELEGISGGSIWSIKPDPPKELVWSPKASIELVGVEVSYLTPSFKYIKGVKWNVVAHLFEYVDPVAKKLIIEKMKSNKCTKADQKSRA